MEIKHFMTTYITCSLNKFDKKVTIRAKSIHFWNFTETLSRSVRLQGTGWNFNTRIRWEKMKLRKKTWERRLFLSLYPCHMHHWCSVIQFTAYKICEILVCKCKKDVMNRTDQVDTNCNIEFIHLLSKNLLINPPKLGVAKLGQISNKQVGKILSRYRTYGSKYPWRVHCYWKIMNFLTKDWNSHSFRIFGCRKFKLIERIFGIFATWWSHSFRHYWHLSLQPFPYISMFFFTFSGLLVPPFIEKKEHGINNQLFIFLIFVEYTVKRRAILIVGHFYLFMNHQQMIWPTASKYSDWNSESITLAH